MPSSPLSVLSQVAQAGQQVGSDVKGIQLKNANVNQYKNATKAPVQTAPTMAPSSPSDKLNKGASAKYGSRPGESRTPMSDAKVMGSFKKGGKVKKTGVYKLHAKERVLNSKQTAKMESKGGIGAVLSGEK